MIALSDREVVRERRFDVIVADLAPTIEPIDIGDAVVGPRTPPQFVALGIVPRLIVLGEELRRGVVQRASLQSFDFAIGGNEAFGVVSHAEVELIDDVRADDANPVG